MPPPPGSRASGWRLPWQRLQPRPTHKSGRRKKKVKGEGPSLRRRTDGRRGHAPDTSFEGQTSCFPLSPDGAPRTSPCGCGGCGGARGRRSVPLLSACRLTCSGAEHRAAYETPVLEAEQLSASPALRAARPVLLASGSCQVLQAPPFCQAPGEVHQGIRHLPCPQVFIGPIDPGGATTGSEPLALGHGTLPLFHPRVCNTPKSPHPPLQSLLFTPASSSLSTDVI